MTTEDLLTTAFLSIIPLLVLIPIDFFLLKYIFKCRTFKELLPQTILFVFCFGLTIFFWNSFCNKYCKYYKINIT